MPYIEPHRRKVFNGNITNLNRALATSDGHPGELNYVITSLLMGTHPEGYSDYNKLIGVLECVKLEMYRRATAPYEDYKMVENGDLISFDAVNRKCADKQRRVHEAANGNNKGAELT